jgi:Domain of unknown function (DUF4350)
MRAPRIAGLAAWVVLIGGFLALFFVGWQTFRTRLETGDSYPEYSTYRADPKGLKALYDSLQATDLLHVSRRLQSSKILPSGENQVLVLAGIRADLQVVSDEDSQLFDHWLATGGRLIVALRPDKIQPTRTQPAPSTNQDATDNTAFVLWRSLIRSWGAEIAPLNDIHLATANSTLFEAISRWLGRNFFERLRSDWKVIAVQGDKDVIVERAFARGSIVLLTDSYPLSNEALAGDRIITLAQRYGLQGTLISIVVVLLLFIWKCQYTLVPRTKFDQSRLTVSGSSSEEAFLNLLRRAVPQKDLLGVCITTWLKTARPTSTQLASLEKFRSNSGEEEPVVERYNQLTTLLNKEL